MAARRSAGTAAAGGVPSPRSRWQQRGLPAQEVPEGQRAARLDEAEGLLAGADRDRVAHLERQSTRPSMLMQSWAASTRTVTAWWGPTTTERRADR